MNTLTREWPSWVKPVLWHLLYAAIGFITGSLLVLVTR